LEAECSNGRTGSRGGVIVGQLDNADRLWPRRFRPVGRQQGIAEMSGDAPTGNENGLPKGKPSIDLVAGGTRPRSTYVSSS
jgi:hypothetical protein